MQRLAWTTDIHLNFVDPRRIEALCQDIAARDAEAVLVGGDIGEGPTVKAYLRTLAEHLRRPIHFVLGNHDFYHGSITRVRGEIEDMVEDSLWLSWLPDRGIVEISEETCLVGHDGWADGRLGDYASSRVELNDYWLIEELSGLGADARLKKLNELGNEAAAHFADVLPRALRHFRHVVALTHVPPFREACWHQGRISDDAYLPHFSCRAVGEVLREWMERFPERQMTALCGHTHGSGEAQILPNLRVKTGGAAYGEPEVTEMLVVG